MLKLIRNGRLYAPDEIGKRDVLIAAGKILKIAEKIDVPQNLEVKTVDAAGKFITPGFIDLHVHITGGGGEGGHAWWQGRHRSISYGKWTKRSGIFVPLGEGDGNPHRPDLSDPCYSIPGTF